MRVFPVWARATIRMVRPRTREARASRGAKHRAVRNAIAAIWPELERHTWAPLFKRASDAGQDLLSESNLWGWQGALPSVLLEVAYWWGEELCGSESATERVRAQAAEVRQIDADICAAAIRLRDLLGRKTELSEFHGIGTEWSGPGLNLLSLLDATIRQRPNFDSRVRHHLDEFLRIGRGTSVSKPQVADLLSVLVEGGPGPVTGDHGDVRASLNLPAGSAIAGTAAAVRRFFGQVDELSMFDLAGVNRRPLDWLTSKGIAVLLSGAAGPAMGAGPINEAQIKKLRKRYRREEP